MNSEMLIRITRYYRALNKLRTIGLEKVFAHNLADAAGVSAAIVRKDFSQLNIHGQKRGGYEIIELISALGKILGKGEPENLVVVGCGRIGKALIHYSGFENDGLNIIAGFDNNIDLISDDRNNVPIYPISKFKEFCEQHNVQVAIIAVPESSAQDTYTHILDCNIKGILNFTPITLRPVPTKDGSIPVVHNINIGLELEQIFYELKFPKK
ncbi:MAG: redox-sensing transcriptional repressor Rex [Sphaerochaetaceae bacterium]|nr:redox-sensing transcriptional repressor Rex [Sphaerochaetaceae bacterium]